MKNITLPDFLTEDEIEQAFAICREEQTPNRRLVAEIIQPNIERINRDLGQENDPSYLAYAIEYVWGQVEGP